MYRHTQVGTVIRWAMLGSAALTAGLFFLLPADAELRMARVGLLITALALLGTMGVFGSLTISVAEGALSWSFGPGVLRKSVPVSAVAEAVPTRTTFFKG